MEATSPVYGQFHVPCRVGEKNPRVRCSPHLIYETFPTLRRFRFALRFSTLVTGDTVALQGCQMFGRGQGKRRFRPMQAAM